jgi:hypothetical protein
MAIAVLFSDFCKPDGYSSRLGKTYLPCNQSVYGIGVKILISILLYSDAGVNIQGAAYGTVAAMPLRHCLT